MAMEFEDLFECVSVCAGEGRCGNLHGKALAPDPFGAGDWCDEINACLSEEAASWVLALFPDTACGGVEGFCPTAASCRMFSSGQVTEDMVRELCEATLIDGVDEAECIVWGP
jgi:hypothetical protein